jgi:hypothetical protein
MDVQLSATTVLELTNLLTAVAAAPGTGRDERYELTWSRDQVATRMPPVEVLVLAGLLREATDRLGLDPATRRACDRWSVELTGLLSATSARPALAIAC